MTVVCRMKREAGALKFYILHNNPGTAPATVNELRWISSHCADAWEGNPSGVIPLVSPETGLEPAVGYYGG